MSRASVREALRSLELLGVVETRAGGGTFVRRTAPEDLARPLSNLIVRGHTLTDVIEVRGLIEPAIAASAAKRIRAKDWPNAEEFATKNVITPPTVDEALSFMRGLEAKQQAGRA